MTGRVGDKGGDRVRWSKLRVVAVVAVVAVVVVVVLPPLAAVDDAAVFILLSLIT